MERFYDRYKGVHLISDDIAWPKGGQKLLRKPTSKTPKEVSAHLDWLETFSPDQMMSSAYKDSGDFLVEALLKGGDGTHPDRFAYPILYLYRHAVELQLKEILSIGLRLSLIAPSQKLEDAIENHNLYPLWNLARIVFEARWPLGDVAVLSAVEGEIQELHSADPDGQRLRYSKTKDGETFPRVLPDQLDLLHLRTCFEGLWNFLEGGIDGLLDSLQNLEEMDAYFSPDSY